MGAPSGAQHEIRHGDQRAVVVEVGGGLREYSVGDRAILDGYAATAMADGARGQALLPWPNRVRDGRFEFGGRTLQLPIDEVQRNCAIHGLTRWSNWVAGRHDESRVTMFLTLHPQPGYPFTLELALAYSLGDDGLLVEVGATNPGVEAAPFGAGFHPYLAPSGDSIDGEELQLPATRHLDLDARGLPTGSVLDGAGGTLDFSAARRVGAVRLDACFTGLRRDPFGHAEVRFSRTTLWCGREFEYLMVFTGDTLEPERRRRGLAVEPMTCPPNSFGDGNGVILLGPGQSFRGEWGIRPV